METSVKNQSKLETFLANSEFNRFGIICVVLTLVGCLGGIAVGLGAIENTMALVAVVIPTMFTLSMLIAVAPMSYLFFSAMISISVDLFLIAYYLIN